MRGTSYKGMPTLLLCWNDERTCVVPLASPNSDTFACGMDFYLVIAGVAVVDVRHVGQGVLVAGLLSYLRIKPFHGGALDGGKDVATGIVRIIYQAGGTSFLRKPKYQAGFKKVFLEGEPHRGG